MHTHTHTHTHMHTHTHAHAHTRAHIHAPMYVCMLAIHECNHHYIFMNYSYIRNHSYDVHSIKYGTYTNAHTV